MAPGLDAQGGGPSPTRGAQQAGAGRPSRRCRQSPTSSPTQPDRIDRSPNKKLRASSAHQARGGSRIRTEPSPAPVLPNPGSAALGTGCRRSGKRRAARAVCPGPPAGRPFTTAAKSNRHRGQQAQPATLSGLRGNSGSSPPIAVYPERKAGASAANVKLGSWKPPSHLFKIQRYAAAMPGLAPQVSVKSWRASRSRGRSPGGTARAGCSRPFARWRSGNTGPAAAHRQPGRTVGDSQEDSCRPCCALRERAVAWLVPLRQYFRLRWRLPGRGGRENRGQSGHDPVLDRRDSCAGGKQLSRFAERIGISFETVKSGLYKGHSLAGIAPSPRRSGQLLRRGSTPATASSWPPSHGPPPQRGGGTSFRRLGRVFSGAQSKSSLVDGTGRRGQRPPPAGPTDGIGETRSDPHPMASRRKL